MAGARVAGRGRAGATWAPEGRFAGTPPGEDWEAIELRSDLARHLDRTAFPATRAYLLETLAGTGRTAAAGRGVVAPGRRHVRQPGRAASGALASHGRASGLSRSPGRRHGSVLSRRRHRRRGRLIHRGVHADLDIPLESPRDRAVAFGLMSCPVERGRVRSRDPAVHVEL